MARVIVLGGRGAVGRVTARTLAAHGGFDEVVVADIDEAGAWTVAAEAGGAGAGVSARRVDCSDRADVRRAVAGCDVVVNCAGPFYALARTTLDAVIDEKVPTYVDVCDDIDATRELLDLDGRAREAGVTAVLGMGNSPGVTNLLGKLAYDRLLDETDAVDIYHAHGGEAFEGPGVVAHRFHGMSMDIPMFLDGAMKTVRFFEPDGMALRERVDFHLVGDDVPVYPYPHPEQLTMPQHMRLARVTNRGTVLPDAYFQLTTEVARLGLTDLRPVEVGGRPVTPREFAIAFLLRERDRILAETDFGSQRGCTKVVVSGTRRGEPRTYIFSMASTDQALGEGTGIPAAMGAILALQGKIRGGPGVLPPEACIEPLDFLALVKPVLALLAGEGSFDGVVVDKIGADGVSQRVQLPF